MKDWNTTKIIKFTLAMTAGFIIYDVLFKDSVEMDKRYCNGSSYWGYCMGVYPIFGQ